MSVSYPNLAVIHLAPSANPLCDFYHCTLAEPVFIHRLNGIVQSTNFDLAFFTQTLRPYDSSWFIASLYTDFIVELNHYLIEGRGGPILQK